MSHQDWKTVIFTKTKPIKNNLSSQLPSIKEFTYSNPELPLALQQARYTKGYTQRSLAIKLNLNVHELNLWEKGSKIPNNNTIALLSKELGVKLPRSTKNLKKSE
jgi:ribosome-binding protein aMBF1 (putative translation factor)